MKTAITASALTLCAICCLVSCSPAKNLRTSGDVSFVSNFSGVQESLAAIAKTKPGMSLAQMAEGSPVSGADLGLVELSGAMSRQAGEFASLRPFRPGMKCPAGLLAGVSGFPAGQGDWFLPAASYAWGLFSDRAILDANGLKAPGDLDALKADCAALKSKGIVPIAIGNSHGWPMLGWFAAMDMLRNGPDSYAKLLGGKRSYSGAESMRSLTELNEWSKSGYFYADGADKLWTEGVRLLNEGKAGFLFVGANAEERVTDPAAVSFSLLSRASGKAPAAALGSVAGFVLPASGSDREAALSLADSFIAAGSPGLTGDGYRVPAMKAKKIKKTDAKGFEPDAIQAVTARALESGTRLMPPLDFLLSEQAAYDLRGAFHSWPLQGFSSQAELKAFAEKLDSLTRSAK